MTNPPCDSTAPDGVTRCGRPAHHDGACHEHAESDADDGSARAGNAAEPPEQRATRQPTAEEAAALLRVRATIDLMRERADAALARTRESRP